MKAKRPSGFTLMELLITAVLLTLVMTAAYTSFSSAVRIWRLGEENIAAYQDARLSLALLSQDLKSALPSVWDMAEGNEKELAWFTVRPTMNNTEDDIRRIVWVHYYVKPTGQGKFRLLREEQQCLEFLPLRPAGKTFQRKHTDVALGKKKISELCRDVSSINFRYFWTLLPDLQHHYDEDTTNPSPPPIENKTLLWEYGMPQTIRISLGMKDTTSESGETQFESWVVLPGSLPRVREK